MLKSGETNMPDNHDTYNFHQPSKTYPINMEPKIGKTECNVMPGRCLNNLMALHKHHLLVAAPPYVRNRTIYILLNSPSNLSLLLASLC